MTARSGTIALILAILAPTGGSAAIGCERPVPVVGDACAQDGGYVLHLRDGSTLFTHGPDAAPGHALGAEVPQPQPVSCVSDTSVEPHGLVIYYRTTEVADLYASRLEDIRTQVEVANAKVLEEAATFGLDIRFRMACTDGRPTVDHVRGTRVRAETTFDSIIEDLRAVGYADTHQKYWIWVEGPRNLGGAAGIGSIWNDETSEAFNANNYGASYAATFGYTMAQGGWSVMLHEASHNLGAVQNGAPFSSGAGHCNDGHDIMCYADNGPKSFYSTARCPTSFRFDCGNNDYFNPRPDPSSYIGRRWNLAAPPNRFVAGCAYAAARVLPPAPLVVDVSGCNGAPYSAAGFLPPRDLRSTARAADAARDPAFGPDADVCFYAGSTELSCSKAPFRGERGTVPDGATTAVVTGGATPVADVVFSAI